MRIESKILIMKMVRLIGAIWKFGNNAVRSIMRTSFGSVGRVLQAVL